MSYLTFSKKTAAYLAVKTGLGQEKEIILTYIIEVLIINAANIIGTLLLAGILDVLPGTAACLLVAFLFRHTAGGAHSSSPWRCAAITITTFPLLALAAKTLASLFSMQYIDILSTIALLLGFIMVARLAPVDSAAAPVISPVRRRKLKILSMGVIAFLTLAVLILRTLPWIYAVEIQAGISLCVLWATLMLTGTGHKVMNMLDRFTIKRKEGTLR